LAPGCRVCRRDAPLKRRPDLADDEELMGKVDSAFKLAYALGFFSPAGLIDRIGTRRGYGVSIGLVEPSGHGTPGSFRSHGDRKPSWARFLLGIGEAGQFSIRYQDR